MMQLSRFPRARLAHLPTPLEPLQALTAHLQGPQVYIKRDDCTGLAFGGNKTRKLEYLLGEAQALGATTIFSEGGLQSNHVRQTAAAAARLGLKCELVLSRNVPGRPQDYEVTGNIFIDRLLNARIHVCEPGEDRSARMAAEMDAARDRGEVPYHIPTGGSNATGALGYVSCMLELLDQARSRDLTIDHLVLASGSGGTQAGMAIGLSATQSGVRGIGIDIDNDGPQVMRDVRRIADDCCTKLGIPALPDGDFVLETGHARTGYGVPTPEMVEAVRLVARLEAILLDPVYSGKAMAGLISMIAEGRFRRDETVVFVHTGGAPGLFAYIDAF